MNDEDYMRLALQLAKKGCGWTSPNPMVGAVVVKEGRTIGQGWHQRNGQAHAERNALASCAEDPQGATLYVTLEPCCHYGKQPPCVDAILDAGIHRVVVGSADPNPLVAGKGIAILRAHGIDVTENVLQEECDALNKVFFHYITTKRPFVSMKYAMTMDGKIATYTGVSKWITHADLAAGCAAEAVVPADEVVIFGVDLREGGGVILALVPQVDLHIVSKLIALGAAHGRGRAQLVDVGGDQLHHRLHGAGGAGAGRGERHLQMQARLCRSL